MSRVMHEAAPVGDIAAEQSVLDCDIFQKNAACCKRTTTVIATSLLPPHREPPALLVVEPELRDGGGFGASFFQRLDGSEWYGARS